MFAQIDFFKIFALRPDLYILVFAAHSGTSGVIFRAKIAKICTDKK